MSERAGRDTPVKAYITCCTSSLDSFQNESMFAFLTCECPETFGAPFALSKVTAYSIAQTPLLVEGRSGL